MKEMHVYFTITNGHTTGFSAVSYGGLSYPQDDTDTDFNNTYSRLCLSETKGNKKEEKSDENQK